MLDRQQIDALVERLLEPMPLTMASTTASSRRIQHLEDQLGKLRREYEELKAAKLEDVDKIFEEQAAIVEERMQTAERIASRHEQELGRYRHREQAFAASEERIGELEAAVAQLQLQMSDKELEVQRLSAALLGAHSRMVVMEQKMKDAEAAAAREAHEAREACEVEAAAAAAAAEEACRALPVGCGLRTTMLGERHFGFHHAPTGFRFELRPGTVDDPDLPEAAGKAWWQYRPLALGSASLPDFYEEEFMFDNEGRAAFMSALVRALDCSASPQRQASAAAGRAEGMEP